MGVAISHCEMQDDFSLIEHHMYASREILTASVTIHANKLNRIKNGKLSAFTNNILRNRSAATKALESARQYLRSHGLTGGEKFVSSNSELVFVENDSIKMKNMVHGDVVLNLSREPHEHKGPTASRIYQDTPLKIPPPKPLSGPTGGIGVNNVAFERQYADVGSVNDNNEIGGVASVVADPAPTDN